MRLTLLGYCINLICLMTILQRIEGVHTTHHLHFIRIEASEWLNFFPFILKTELGLFFCHSCLPLIKSNLKKLFSNMIRFTKMSFLLRTGMYVTSSISSRYSLFVVSICFSAFLFSDALVLHFWLLLKSCRHLI